MSILHCWWVLGCSAVLGCRQDEIPEPTDDNHNMKMGSGNDYLAKPI
jgi:hypothetical protein